MTAVTRPRLIVLGNEKGGSGKSTTAMHVIAAALRQGLAVGAIDLDARQASLSRYIENRRLYNERAEAENQLPLPRLIALLPSLLDSRAAAEAADEAAFNAAIEALGDCALIVIDTPGSDSALSRAAHQAADLLLSPMNDSFLDLDLLGRVEAKAEQLGRPMAYAETVWRQRQRRALQGRKPIDWVLMRNRLSQLDARNKREIGRLLEKLAKRIGFRIAPGLSERVIFRELFPLGLTLIDLDEGGPGQGGPGHGGHGIERRMSHLAAREELRALLAAIGVG